MAGDLPRGPFGAILADPPWGWRTWNALDKVPHRGAEAPYQPMTKAALEALPVGDVAAPHSLLFMWQVSSHIDQGIDLAKAWGFQHRALGFVWIKTDKAGRPRMSLGRWTRQEAEICLIFGKGRPPRLSGGVRQVIMAPRREHSRKPDEVADRIRALVGGPYLELFSRTSRPGWSHWGDETGKFDGIRTPAAAEKAAIDTGGTRTPRGRGACAAHLVGAVCNCDLCAACRLRILELIA